MGANAGIISIVGIDTTAAAVGTLIIAGATVLLVAATTTGTGDGGTDEV